jgi:hypothetical protein
MPLSFSEIFAMAFRRSPVGKIRQALAKCEAAGFNVTATDLEAHHFCGHDPLLLAEALVTARQLGIETSLQEMSVIILAGKDPLELLPLAAKTKTVRFDTFSPKREDKLRGFTKDGREVFAAITINFRLSPRQLAFDFDFRHAHERLAAVLSVYINTAENFHALELNKKQHEAELHSLGVETIPGLKSVLIEYR